MGCQSMTGNSQTFFEAAPTILWCPFIPIYMGGDRHCKSYVSFQITQRSELTRARTQTVRSGVQRTNHLAIASPTRNGLEKVNDICRVKVETF